MPKANFTPKKTPPISFMQAFFILLIRTYQFLSHIFRPLFAIFFTPSVCRFTPSCSQYALEAIARHGTLQGLRLSLHRLSRCHPGSPGGVDPVPF